MARLIRRRLTLAALAAAVSTGTASAAARVTGGSPIQIQTAPWTVYVQDQAPAGRFLCTGTIVDASHILTAAHCVFDEAGRMALPSALSVRAGVSNFSAPLPTDLEQDRSVTSFRVHPGYAWTTRLATDDVAVLALASPLDLSGPGAQAVALPSTSAPFPDGTAVGLAGFGRQSPTANASGPLSWMTATVDPHGSCGGPDLGVIYADAVILCAASPASAACNGDSGSGLVTTDTHILVGVVSAGPSGCGAGSHTLYTYLGAPETLRFVQGDDHPPTAPRETPATFVELRWNPPLVVGNTLSCSSGDWSGAARLSYAFSDSADGRPLQIGSSATYRLTSGDIGRKIFCEVRAANDGGLGLDETTATSGVKPAPKVRILAVAPVAAVRGGAVTLHVSLRAPAGLWGKFGVCFTASPRVGGRICSSQPNPDGAGGTFPFTLRLRVKPTAPLVSTRVAVTAVAGVSRAHTTVLVRISRA